MGMQIEVTNIKIIQRYALACLYFASHGESWKNNYSFLSGKNECEWNEIDNKGLMNGAGGCEPDGHTIKIISLWNNNLLGHIPREVSLLTNLRVLSVYDNQLKGPLAATLGKLTSLKTLYIHGNFITGSINFMCHYNLPNLRADC